MMEQARFNSCNDPFVLLSLFFRELNSKLKKIEQQTAQKYDSTIYPSPLQRSKIRGANPNHNCFSEGNWLFEFNQGVSNPSNALSAILTTVRARAC